MAAAACRARRRAPEGKGGVCGSYTALFLGPVDTAAGMSLEGCTRVAAFAHRLHQQLPETSIPAARVHAYRAFTNIPYSAPGSPPLVRVTPRHVSVASAVNRGNQACLIRSKYRWRHYDQVGSVSLAALPHLPFPAPVALFEWIAITVLMSMITRCCGCSDSALLAGTGCGRKPIIAEAKFICRPRGWYPRTHLLFTGSTPPVPPGGTFDGR